MNKIIYEELKNKLDSVTLRLQVFHQIPNPTELPHSVGLIINKDTNVEMLNEGQMVLAHSLLHMFYSNKSGKGLSPKTIEKLHDDIVPFLKKHNKFDRLDKR